MSIIPDSKKVRILKKNFIKSQEKKYSAVSFSELYDTYDTCNYLLDKGIDKGKNALLKKAIQKVIDQKEYIPENTDYHPYPSINNPNFIYELSKKAEFYHHKMLLNQSDLEKKCEQKKFQLGNHQQFLKSFINEETPYKGLLIFHGVGVGKTCSAISISNSFRDVYKRKKKKIICLVSKNIRPGWLQTIYDPSKNKDQCTGDTYLQVMKSFEKNGFLQQKGKSRNIKKMIHKYYEFYGYREFSGMINRLVRVGKWKNMKKNDPELELRHKQVIKEYFSERLLIIDEVHNLREENDISHSRETIQTIDKIIQYSDNLRLILMSATPMFNKSSEIVWLLNMLLKNDKRPIIEKDDIFDEDDTITSSGEKILVNKSRGYISYLRGENPINFPLRLSPKDGTNDTNVYPVNTLWGERSPYQFKFLDMHISQFTSIQKETYESYIQSIRQSDDINISEQKVGVQISNIVFPTKSKDINFKNMYGKRGMNNILTNEIKNNKITYCYKKDYIKEVEIPMFDEKVLINYSTKIHTIIKNITKTSGIIFIYSEYLSSGIIPISLALEHLGYGKYDNNDLLQYPKWKPGSSKHTKQEPIDYLGKTRSEDDFTKQAKYIILSGNKSLSPNNKEEIKKLVDPSNSYGESIKIVLGNVVASEGLDFKNIREIHILDPWFHLNRVEQIIGRGIRFCSHNVLQDEERNVTVYLHAAIHIPTNDSIDTRTYRLAEQKTKSIGAVETILKRNSIDYFLNKPINYISKKDISPITLVTSKGLKLEKYEIHDREFSKVCSFQRVCEYNSYLTEDVEESLNEISMERVNFDTFSVSTSRELIMKVIDFIVGLFSMNSFYNISELINITLHNIDVNEKIIYHSLTTMIQEKTYLRNKENIFGYMIQKQDYYIFQPFDMYEKSCLFYRTRKQEVPEEYSTLTINWGDSIETDEPIEKLKGYDSLKKTIKDKIKDNGGGNLEKLLENNIISMSKENIQNYVFDTLSYGHKVVILKTILRKSEKDKLESDIVEYFRYNLIYKSSDSKYSIGLEWIRGKIIYKNLSGFYLANGSRDQGPHSFYILDKETWFCLNDDPSTPLHPNNNLIRHKINEAIRDITILDASARTPIMSDRYYTYSIKHKDNHSFKLVNNRQKNTPGKDTLPGIIIEQVSNKNSIRMLFQSIEILKPVYETYTRFLTEKYKDFITLIVQYTKNITSVKKEEIDIIPEVIEEQEDHLNYINQIVISSINKIKASIKTELEKEIKNRYKELKSFYEKKLISTLMEIIFRENNSHVSYDLMDILHTIN